MYGQEAISQVATEEILRDRYWQYRERTRRHFVKIGKEDGESIPIIRIEPEYEMLIIPADKVNLAVPDDQKWETVKGKIFFGDAGVDLGYYMGMLATEYAVLKKEGADLTAIKNELYYAINAFNRLDFNAELYFQTGSGNLNGFFIREDSPSEFYEQFEELGDDAHMLHARHSVAEVDYTPHDASGNALPSRKMFQDKDGNLLFEAWDNKVRQPEFYAGYEANNRYGYKANEMSQDQVIGIAFGIKYIHKFVDDVYVKPTPTDQGFSLVTEAKAILDRILDPIASSKGLLPQFNDRGEDGAETCPNAPSYLEDANIAFNCNISKLTTSWAIKNPVNGKAVWRGPVLYGLGFGFPLKEISEDINGSNTYPTFSVPVIDRIVNLPGGGTSIIPQATNINHKIRFGLTFANVMNPSNASSKFYNVNMFHKLGYAGGGSVADNDDLFDLVEDWDFEHLEIHGVVLNGETSKKGKDYYKNLLLKADCKGPYHTASDKQAVDEARATLLGFEARKKRIIADLLTHSGNPDKVQQLLFEQQWLNGQIASQTPILQAIIYEHSGAWKKEDILAVSDADHYQNGIFNGIDYAFLYNLYRLAFDNDLGDEFVKEYSCPCVQDMNKDKAFYTSTDQAISVLQGGTSNSQINTEYRFPEYIDYDIRLNSYLKHDMTVNQGGSLNTQGNFVLCNSILTIDNGNLNAGTVLDGKNKKFNIAPNSTLDLKSNAVFLVNNNTTVYVEEGANLRIGPSTQVILDGPNAILEIRGNLVLEDGAVFQPVGGPNGQGFVRFNQQHVNSGTATTLVNVGNNSEMIFEAASNSTKVLEVASTDFWINDQGKSFRFTLKNGKAEMAHEAMMNLGCRVTLDGALVEKLPSAGHYRGIVLWNTGYQQVIRNSTFKEASEAVHFIGRNGGSRLVALDNQFTNNYNGLRLTGGSFFLRQANLSDNNGYGLVATGQQRTSTLFESTVNHNNFKGIRYESNVGAGLNLNTNDILENTIGVKFISRGNLNMKCNQVHGIAGFGSPIGLEFYHGNLNMTKNLFRTGNNSFKDNEKSILFPNGVGIEPKIELNNGWNRLSNKGASSPAFYNSLEGQLDVSNAIKLAENNHWDLNNNIPEFNYQPFFINYGNYQTYYLTRMFGPNVLAPTTLDDNGLTLNQSQFTEDWTSECDNDLKWKRAPGGFVDIYPVGEGTVITSTAFNGKHLSDCIEQILVTTSDTLITDGERIELWNELLTYDGYPEEIDKVDEYYLAVAETQLFDVFGNYLLEQDSIHPGLIQDAVVQDVLEVCNFWEQELVGDTSIYSVRFRNKINLSKGHLYHMIDDNAAALNQFGSMQVWADSFALNESGYWMCHINNLEQLNASSYDADLLFSLPECTFSENSNVLYKRNPERIQKSKVELEERFSVFPNPTKDYFNISFFTDQETTVSISLVDIYGKKIKEYGSMDTYVGDNRGRFTTDGLRAGTYFVQFTVDDRTEFKKLVLVD
jgi:hypothetical protein